MVLYSLGALMTVCEIKRNDGAWRLQRILETGSDPGARFEAVEAIKAGDADATDSSESTFDLERLGRDQIQAFVAENFASHGLSELVAERGRLADRAQEGPLRSRMGHSVLPNGGTARAHRLRHIEFDREAPPLWEAIQSAIRDVTTVAGVRVVDVRDSMDALPGPRAEHALA